MTEQVVKLSREVIKLRRYKEEALTGRKTITKQERRIDKLISEIESLNQLMDETKEKLKVSLIRDVQLNLDSMFDLTSRKDSKTIHDRNRYLAEAIESVAEYSNCFCKRQPGTGNLIFSNNLFNEYLVYIKNPFDGGSKESAALIRKLCEGFYAPVNPTMFKGVKARGYLLELDNMPPEVAKIFKPLLD